MISSALDSVSSVVWDSTFLYFVSRELEDSKWHECDYCYQLLCTAFDFKTPSRILYCGIYRTAYGELLCPHNRRLRTDTRPPSPGLVQKAVVCRRRTAQALSARASRTCKQSFTRSSEGRVAVVSSAAARQPQALTGTQFRSTNRFVSQAKGS